MDQLKKFVNITYDDRGRRQFHLKESTPEAKAPASAPKPVAPAIDYSKPLQARSQDIDFDSKLGRRQLGKDEDIAKAAPFRCETCDFSVMDSNSWLDHLNSPSHNRMVGNHMKVERVSVDRVRERIKLLKQQKDAREAAKAPNLSTASTESLDSSDVPTKKRKMQNSPP